MSIKLNGLAQELYEGIATDPIVSPHGHCDPSWFSENQRFSDPAQLLVVPDHYVFRMLYSKGVSMEDLGIGVPANQADPRKIFRKFATAWPLFLGTPSRLWIEFVLQNTLEISTPLSTETADQIYDDIEEKLASSAFLPRALFDRFGIEVLATTDSALDDLGHHETVRESGWAGRVVPTFRPDALLDPYHSDYLASIAELADVTGEEIGDFQTYRDALRMRRAYFKSKGATATDHAIDHLHMEWLSAGDRERLFGASLRAGLTPAEAARFHGHMLIEMAQMSVEDRLVMQLHAGSKRNTNDAVFEKFGRDKGADIPLTTNWVEGLAALLNRVGNSRDLTLILFTLDETTYARELAPMAGHWPCLRIGPPWWFHDSPNGIARYFDQVVETAGYQNLAGFNDDTRAFLSIPARHDMWRKSVGLHLANQIAAGYFNRDDAEMLAKQLSTELARKAYRLDI